MRLGATVTGRPEPPRLWVLLQIAALSVHIPLSLLSGSQRALASTSGVAIVGVGVTSLFLVLFVLLKRLFASGWTALALVSVGIVLFWHGSSFSSNLGALAWPVNLLLAALVFVAAYRFAGRRGFRLATFVAAMTVSTTLVLLAVTDTLTDPDPIVGATTELPELDMSSKPDIYLVLLDGYGRADVMRDRYGFDNGEFLETLQDEGFDVAPYSSSNYTITHLSLPALFEMSYVNQPLDYMNNSDLEKLARITSGENAFVRTLKDSGYTYIHGDSDHWFNTCGPRVDVCLPGPFLDVTGHTLLSTTPVGDLFYPASGDPTTALNLSRIHQMTNWSDVSPPVEGPTFTFLHLVLPHPPLFLDSECNVRIDSDLGGRILNDGQISNSLLKLREAAWLEQVECANETVVRFVDQLSPDDVVVVTSDHGADFEFVIETPDPDDLNPAVLSERFPTLTAVRLPQECRGGLPPDIHTVNLLRFLLGCLSGSELEMLDHRYFAASFGGSIVELKYTNPVAD